MQCFRAGLVQIPGLEDVEQGCLHARFLRDRVVSAGRGELSSVQFGCCFDLQLPRRSCLAGENVIAVRTSLCHFICGWCLTICVSAVCVLAALALPVVLVKVVVPLLVLLLGSHLGLLFCRTRFGLAEQGRFAAFRGGG